AEVAQAPVQATPSAGGLQSVFVARADPAGFAGLARLAPVAGAGPDSQFAWMNSVQLTPIAQVRADKLLPGSRSGLEIDNPGLADRPAPQASADTTAFQFQR